MRVLLDEQLPRQLASRLTGHDVVTVQQQGWAGVTNGELLRRAAEQGFEALVTADQNLEFQQSLEPLPLGRHRRRRAEQCPRRSSSSRPRYPRFAPEERAGPRCCALPSNNPPLERTGPQQARHGRAVVGAGRSTAGRSTTRNPVGSGTRKPFGLSCSLWRIRRPRFPTHPALSNSRRPSRSATCSTSGIGSPRGPRTRVATEARRALLRRFPYAVYFTVDREELVVLAVLHVARDPSEWQRRV